MENKVLIFYNMIIVFNQNINNSILNCKKYFFIKILSKNSAQFVFIQKFINYMIINDNFINLELLKI